jgi:hypothetical protein
MFKHLYVFLLLIPGYFSVQANMIANTNTRSSHHIAGVNEQKYKSHLQYADGAEEIIELILQTIGLQASFEVKRANVPNAAAVVYRGKRYILYNPSFIAAMNKAAGTPWASVAVLAHEIGHHLNGHTLDGKGSLPPIELEADEFSGFVLRKMGASLEEAQLAMRIIATARATGTHPARDDRLMAIADGWNRADGQVKGRDIARQPGHQNVESSGGTSILSEENIAYDVHFTFDPRTRYHVTVRNNLVKLLNNQLQVLGKLWATGKPSFPLAFQTGSKHFLLISKDGQIFNEEGKSLGYIIPRK